MDVDDMLLTTLQYLDQSGEIRRLSAQALSKELAATPLSEGGNKTYLYD